MRVVALDTETHLIKHGEFAPRMVCLSWYDSEGCYGLLHRDEALPFLEQLLVQDVLVVGQNFAFDARVILQQFPTLTKTLFALYRSGRVHDTRIQEKLLAIAEGTLVQLQGNSSLKVLASKYLNLELDKDSYRTSYEDWTDVPVRYWPEGAKKYALEDAQATYGVWKAQQQRSYLLEDSARQARADFVLSLISAHGMHTDVDAVHILDSRIQKELEKERDFLVRECLVVREMATLKKGGKPELGIEIPSNGKTKPRYWTGNFKMNLKATRELVEVTAKEQGLPVPLSPKGVVKTAPEAIAALNSESLDRYCNYHRLGNLKASIKPYYNPPVQTSFDSLQVTGRTSSSRPNVQNIRREPGVRECLIPRPGKLFAAADYSSLELHTLAQVCQSLLGYSALKDALNSGRDAHIDMAADMILKCSYKEALERYGRGDEGAKKARQHAKVANFGFPGGLGAQKLTEYAAATFGVQISVQEAKELKSLWLSKWPEMGDYFQLCSRRLKDACDIQLPDGSWKNVACGYQKQLFTNRYRGKCTYTKMCNTLFQGLGADGAKWAGFLIAENQWCNENSVLFGSRTVNFIHDEFIVEVEENHEKASHCADELARLMCKGMNEFLPDCPVRAEPVLMQRWLKGAKSERDEKGLLIINK